MNATRQKLFDAWKKSKEIKTAITELRDVYKELHKPLFKAFERRNKTDLCELANDINDELTKAFKALERVFCGLDIICDELRIGEKDV